jgi:hypothetical protein
VLAELCFGLCRWSRNIHYCCEVAEFFFFGPERMSEKKETAVVMTGAAVVDILEEDDEFEVDSALFTKDLCS